MGEVWFASDIQSFPYLPYLYLGKEIPEIDTGRVRAGAGARANVIPAPRQMFCGSEV